MTEIDKVINRKNLVKKMKNVMILVLMILLLPMITAEPSYIFKQNTAPDLKISCFDTNNSLCNSATSCYLSVNKPDLTTLVNNVTMTVNVDHYNYTLPNLATTGEYSVVSRCVGNASGFSTFTFEVNPTGASQSNILENPMILILGILALILIGMGTYFKSAWFGFIGSVMFLLGGVYTMIYGFNNIADLYTRAIAVVFLGLGIIFMFLSAYEWIWGEKD